MNTIPTTLDIQTFATEHHDLVFKFLNMKGLCEDDYYDIVVFGYMKAVKNYLSDYELREKYPFATIAFRKMKDSLSEEYLKMNRQKRKAITISLDAPYYDGWDSAPLSVEEVLTAHDSEMDDFEMKLLLLDLASHVSKKEMEIVRMRLDGYGVKDIARRQSATIPQIKKMLDGLYKVTVSVCYN